MSHFIWGISLTVPVYFVVFYALERIKHDKAWWILASLVMVTAFTSSPTHGTYFGLFFVFYFLAKTILQRKLLFYDALAGISGAALSFIFWWIPMFTRYGVSETLKGLGIQVGTGVAALGVGGTADRVYTFRDFFFALKQNMINNPIGIGIVLSILTVVALIFLLFRLKNMLKKENHWLGITFVWFILTFYAVNAVNMPIKISPFRAWMLLAIPVCILAAQGAFDIMAIAKKSSGKIGMYFILLLLLAGIYFTSTQQKIAVNTATWPPGAFWTSGEEIGAYLWMKENFAKNSRIFAFSHDDPIIGVDMFSCRWCDDVLDYRKNNFNDTAQETYNWLKSKDYGYLIIDGRTAKTFGANETNTKVQEIAQSGLFRPVFQNQGAVIFKI